MPNRIRLNIVWTFNRDHFKGAWHEVVDFKNYALRHLHGAFAHYGSEMQFEELSHERQQTRMKITWEVNLDMVPGAWHQSEDHVRVAHAVLVDNLRTYALGTEITVEDLGYVSAQRNAA